MRIINLYFKVKNSVDRSTLEFSATKVLSNHLFCVRLFFDFEYSQYEISLKVRNFVYIRGLNGS